LGGVADEGFLRAQQPRQFVFPADHGAHPGYRSEWWYVTAALADGQGREYGVQFTLFRQALTPAPVAEGPWHAGVVYLGHLAVTDVAAQYHTEAQRFARGHPQLAGVRGGGDWALYIDDWTLQQQHEQQQPALTFRIKAQDRGRSGHEFGVDLRLTGTGAIVLQGQRGLSRKSADGGSYYYSVPGLQVQGTLHLADHPVTVSGLGWMDREWSTSVLPEGVAGWDWFALQLRDGRSIMAFRLRRRDGSRDKFDHGIVVGAQAPREGVIGAGDPGVRVLSPTDFELRPLRYWRDERGIEWPVGWSLAIGEETFSITALVDDQVMETAILYWEGIVGVADQVGVDIGRGYMELTGYAAH
jgi:predicted secreted hydrolase